MKLHHTSMTVRFERKRESGMTKVCPDSHDSNPNFYKAYCMVLKVVCNEMKEGSDTCLSYSYSYGTHVTEVCFNFNGGVVFK